jgi:hypothetical protein
MSVTFPMAAWATRLRTGCVLLSLVSLLGGCDAERSTSPSSPSAGENAGEEFTALDPSTTASATATCSAPSGARVVKVSSASALSSALSNARAGDFILMANGTYEGRFRARAQGSQSARITLCGSAGAVISDRDRRGYALGVDGARWWVFRGFTIDRGLKGIMADRAYDNVYEHLTVKNIAGECVHMRQGSSRNIIRNNYIHHCGATSQYGEGVYIGSSPNNYDNDRANDNEILDNTIEYTAADGVDIKESTTGTVVEGNVIRKTGTGGCPLPSDPTKAPSCSGSNSSAPVTGRPSDSVFECNDITPASMFKGRMIAIYSGAGGDDNLIRWNKSGSVSIPSSQTGNTVTQNSQDGYEDRC